jgi:hypothetical protein
MGNKVTAGWRAEVQFLEKTGRVFIIIMSRLTVDIGHSPVQLVSNAFSSWKAFGCRQDLMPKFRKY